MSNAHIHEEQEEYVTWKRGMELLGISRGSFYYLVETKQITEKPGSGKRDRLFSLRDIQEIKERKEHGKRKEYKKRALQVEVDFQRISDLPATLALDMEAYGEDITMGDFKFYASWLRRNPQVTFMAYDKKDRGKIYAYVCLLPMKEETIRSILRGDRHETTIEPNDIETYEREGEYTLLAESVVVHPEHHDQLNRLLNAVLNHWIALYPQRTVSKVYAQSASEKGDIMIQKFFFAPLYDLAPNAYVLDLKRPGASLPIRWFQKMLAEKQ